MDNRAKKQWLKKYQAATREIEDLIRERAVWRERGETRTQVISEMPHGGGTSDKTGEAAARRAYNDKRRLLADAENAARTMAFEGERRMEKRRRIR